MKEFEGVYTKTMKEIKKEKLERENRLAAAIYDAAQDLKPQTVVSILATSLVGFSFLATTHYA